MVHLGHKTEEPAFVLTKPQSNKRSWGAQTVKTLCLSSMVFGALVVVMPVSAQVYSTEPQPNVQSSARMELRLQQMENDLRSLTGKVEEQNYTINKLNNQIENLNKLVEEQGSEPAYKATSQSHIAPNSVRTDPLNLGVVKPPEIKGMQTAQPKPSTDKQSATDVTAQYESAFALLKQDDYSAAQQGFENFLKSNKDHVLSANAKYWLAETFYVRGEYKTAARHFAEGFQTHPDSAKSPDMLLKLGMALNGMGKTKDACIAFSQLPVKFPTGHGEVLKRGASQMEKLGCES